MSAITIHLVRRTHIGLLALVLAAFALRVVTLDRLGLAYDEAASALMARATPLEIITFHWNAAYEHPPVWVLLMHGWSQIAGQSEFALRFLPALAGTALVVIVWRLARSIWPDEPLLPSLSALLVAFAPVLVYYSQEARMYTLVVLLMLLSFRLMLRLHAQPSWGTVIAFCLVSWCMLGLHYYAALGLAIQALVIITHGVLAGPMRRIPWIKRFVAFAGALLPLLLWMIFSPGFRTTFTAVLNSVGANPISWHFYLSDLWRELSFGSIRWLPPLARWGYIVAPLMLLGALLVAILPGRTRRASMGAWIVVALALLPILSGVLAFRTLAPRYILWAVPMCYVLVALLAAALWRRQWLAGVIVMLLVIGVDILALQHYLGPYRKSEYREMATYLQARGDPQAEILLLEAPRQHLLAKYYVAPEWSVHPIPTFPLPSYWPVTAPRIVPEDEDDRIQAWLAEYDGLWVSYTSEVEVDAGEFLAKYLTAVAYREHCTQWLDVRLCHYVSPHQLTPVELAPTPILFGGELALIDAKGTFYHLAPDTTRLLVQLDWHAQQKPSLDYKVALRLLSDDGSIVDQADDYPIGSLLVPTTWNQDDHKPGYFALTLPPHLAAGHYDLQVSLYDANTLAPTTSTDVGATSPPNPPATEPRTIAELHVGDTMQLLPAPSSR
jgi:mannosyltransferase